MGVVLSGLTRLTGCDPYSKYKLLHRAACGAKEFYVRFGYGLMGTASDLRPCKPKLHVAFRYSYAHGFINVCAGFTVMRTGFIDTRTGVTVMRISFCGCMVLLCQNL